MPKECKDGKSLFKNNNNNKIIIHLNGLKPCQHHKNSILNKQKYVV